MMKNIFKVFCLSVVCISFICSTNSFALNKNRPNRASREETLNTIVAIVNDDIVTESELQKRVRLYKLEAKDALMASDNTIRNQVLNQLIEQKIALQTAARVGIEVEDELVNRSIQSLLEKNNLSQGQLETLLTEHQSSYTDYQNIVHDELLLQKFLQQEVGGRIKISKQEVDRYLNSLVYSQNNITEYKIADILIALPEVPSSNDTQKANKKADLIIRKLAKGENFEDLAAKYSQANNALEGGDMGWRRVEEIPLLFVNEAKTLKVGDYAGPIKAANGLHILKLLDVKGQKLRHVVTEYKTRHILIKVEIIDDDDAVKSRLANLRQRVMQGESFEELARQYSQDPVSAAKGGSLGWVPPGVMVPEFENVMTNQALKQVSQPFRSQYGWHILLVEDKRNKDNTKEHYANELRQKIYQRKFVEESQNLLRRLRNSSFVEVHSKKNA